MVKVGIIGCGNIARFHYEGYEKAGAQITHVCDIRQEAATALAQRYGAKASTDYRAVLADPNVDLVSILTFGSTHLEIGLAAVAAGKAVVCEKTLTDGPAASATLARAAAQARTFFATGYMKRYFPAAQQAKKLLAGMGPLVSIHARTWQPFPGLFEQPLPEWEWLRQRPSPVIRNYGGGVLVCGGSHILDLLHWFAGRPLRVSGQMRFRPELDFDIQANALLAYENDAVAHLECCWHSLRFAGYERKGWDERLEINTTDGRLDFYTVKWDEPEKNGALLVHQDAVTGTTTEYRYPAVNPFHLEMAEMLRRYEAGEAPEPSAWDGYVVDETIAAITTSAREKRTVEMCWQDR
jgi:predicted dehydrogenase